MVKWIFVLVNDGDCNIEEFWLYSSWGEETDIGSDFMYTQAYSQTILVSVSK